MSEVSSDLSIEGASKWGGGNQPLEASYGKLMMWFFLLSDAFSFAGLLITYGFLRFGKDSWPIPEEVYDAYPFGVELASLTGLDIAHFKLGFVGLMTLILILSSITMIFAVEAGSRMDRIATEKWMLWTIIGGFTFLGCQAWEWSHFIHGTAEGGTALQFINGEWVEAKFYGANLTANQYGPRNFAQLFFFITGFHGFHVFSGVVLNILVFYNVATGVYERRGHYEMVEKVGLYWHFVDLVWVFVFTFFYMI